MEFKDVDWSLDSERHQTVTHMFLSSVPGMARIGKIIGVGCSVLDVDGQGSTSGYRRAVSEFCCLDLTRSRKVAEKPVAVQSGPHDIDDRFHTSQIGDSQRDRMCRGLRTASRLHDGRACQICGRTITANALLPWMMNEESSIQAFNSESKVVHRNNSREEVPQDDIQGELLQKKVMGTSPVQDAEWH